MDFYQHIVTKGETISDIAMQEYGDVFGIFLLVADNVALASVNNDPIADTVLNIRVAPDPSVIDQQMMNYVRGTDPLKVIQLLPGVPVTIRNTDGSWVVSANNGDTEIVPDTAFTDSDGSFRNVPATIPITAKLLIDIMEVTTAQTKILNNTYYH